MSGPEYDCAKCGKVIAFPWIGQNGAKYCSIACMESHEYGELETPVCGKDKAVHEDVVLSPSHYTAGGIETIDFIRAKLTPDEFRGFLKGSIIKYLSRANLKGNEEQDYAKASFYARMLAGDDPRGEAQA